MTRRLWVAAALTFPLLAVMVSDVLPGRPLRSMLPGATMGWCELLLAQPL